MFEEENWVDNNNGKKLQSALFSHPESQKCAGKSAPDLAKRKKKRNKTIQSDSRQSNVANQQEFNIFDPHISVKTVELADHSKLIKSSKQRKQHVDQQFEEKRQGDCETMSAHSNKRLKVTKQSDESKYARNRDTKKAWRNKGHTEVEMKFQAKSDKPSKNERYNFEKFFNKTDSGSSETRSQLLRERVTSKLQSAHFRFINEQLYSCKQGEAKELFQNNPTAFQAYHSGFMKQVSKWPINPLDVIIAFLKKRPSKWVIGDFGCGDARLAASVKNEVHSFDLVAFNERVTVADISKVTPLEDGVLDVAVFCLSLMGTNFTEYISEANRTLKYGGLLKIAEVTSRFTSVSKFVNVMKRLGFELENQDRKNTHFFMLDFRKARNPQSGYEAPESLLKPCLYKKR